MKEEYTSAFHRVVKTTQAETGYMLPEHIESYVVFLLADHVDKRDFLPQTSFAEIYLDLNSSRSAKELGDTCLFVTGVFPEYGKRKGLKRSYYIEIGQGSYQRASTSLNTPLFNELSTHFEFLSNFIGITVKSKNISSLI